MLLIDKPPAALSPFFLSHSDEDDKVTELFQQIINEDLPTHHSSGNILISISNKKTILGDDFDLEEYYLRH